MRHTREQLSIKSPVKLVDKPLQSPTFLALVEIDLMAFQNCQCHCSRQHKWAINISDHGTKYVYTVPLKDKTADEMLKVFQCYCFTYEFPKTILAANSKEFANKKMEVICKENGIEVAHGSPQTPTTQGLVERLWKEDMQALILSTSSKNLKKWCEKAPDAAYSRNISYHRTIKMTPYEAVYGIKNHRHFSKFRG